MNQRILFGVGWWDGRRWWGSEGGWCSTPLWNMVEPVVLLLLIRVEKLVLLLLKSWFTIYPSLLAHQNYYPLGGSSMSIRIPTQYSLSYKGTYLGSSSTHEKDTYIEMLLYPLNRELEPQMLLIFTSEKVDTIIG